MQPASSQQLANRYTLLERVAVGGMGEVWRARDDVLHRTVAVKILAHQYLDSPEFASRFRAEARHSASLSHAGVANVYDYGEDAAGAFLVMEFVDGEPLSALLARTPIPPLTTTLSILAQTADALEAAHEAGIVHRDVKPGNIMITPAGVAKVTDFGIARAVDALPLTAVGQVVGTPQYMSPEQASGQPVGPASDVYSLGVIGFEALAGRRPFVGETPLALAMAHVNTAPPALADTVPAGVRDLIARALAKNPSDRPPSAAVFATELRAQQMRLMPPPDAAVAEPGAAVAATQQMPMDGFVRAAPGLVVDSDAVMPRQRRARVLIAVAAAVVAIVLLVTLTRQTDDKSALLAAASASNASSTTLATEVSTTTIVATTAETVAVLAPPPTAPAPTTAPTLVVDPQAYVGRPVADVQRELEALGFTVVQEKAKGKARTGSSVVEVRPSGNVAAGSTITLVVGRVKTDD